MITETLPLAGLGGQREEDGITKIRTLEDWAGGPGTQTSEDGAWPVGVSLTWTPSC